MGRQEEARSAFRRPRSDACRRRRSPGRCRRRWWGCADVDHRDTAGAASADPHRVGEFAEDTLRAALMREESRGGQSFVVVPGRRHGAVGACWRDSLPNSTCRGARQEAVGGHRRDDGAVRWRRRRRADRHQYHRGGAGRAAREHDGRSCMPTGSGWRSCTSCGGASGAAGRRGQLLLFTDTGDADFRHTNARTVDTLEAFVGSAPALRQCPRPRSARRR